MKKNDNEKAWETRRRLYGPTGNNRAPDQLPWCPPEWRAEYQRLRSGKRLGAQAAREIIEQEIARASA